MPRKQGSADQLRKLASEVVRIILQDESLAAELGDGLLAVAQKPCPKDHKCTDPFKCSHPFKCPKGHTVEPKIAV